jgi:hypothetical protein
MSCENREIQIPDLSKKSGILLFTNDLGLLNLTIKADFYINTVQLRLKLCYQSRFFNEPPRRRERREKKEMIN